MQQLLVQFPRIEVLWVEPWPTRTWDLFLFVDDPVTQSLPALRKVQIHYPHSWGTVDLSTVTSLFSLGANIDTLAISYCNRVSCTLSLQNVTCLILERCYFTACCMSKLLSSCGKLDTFAYLFTKGQVSANELVCLLEEQGHNRTLRRLSFSYKTVQEYTSSLVSFSQLQILRLCFGVWPETMPEELRAEWLPPSLEDIAVSEGCKGLFFSGHEWLKWIRAKNSSGFFPRLRKLKIDREWLYEGFFYCRRWMITRRGLRCREHT
ncbi:hypothetical protein F4860DRAFT_497230 [Xylaria cubensis]|nr:hypothetical protein F4860DRAFT_497230 [Xylaria cubensis]